MLYYLKLLNFNFHKYATSYRLKASKFIQMPYFV